MSAKELDTSAIRAREAVATPGPWTVIEPMVQNEAGDYSPAELRGPVWHSYEDTAFSAHARQDIPDLLNEVDRLRKAVHDAPHGPACFGLSHYGNEDDCDCWKADLQ